MSRRVAVPVALLVAGVVGASLARPDVARAGSPMHPDVRLLDDAGDGVLESGRPVSPARTCGQCHDVEFIERHDFHATLGADERRAPGTVAGGRPWDTSAGPFGRWDPATNRRLALEDDARFDLGVADWLRTVGQRHVGGGPARLGADGRPLDGEGPRVETHALDPVTGRPAPWDWAASGTAELDCFLCHVPGARADLRRATLAAGRFRWAATATLVGTGLVAADGDGFRWVREAFTKHGTADRAKLPLGRPTAAACGACHLDPDAGTRGTFVGRDPRAGGQVVAPGRIADAALNLADKDARTGPFDVHAARLVGCTDCHHSLNDPARFAEAAGSRPGHLAYDARRLSVGEFVRTPSHDLAKGTSSRPHAAEGLDGTVRRCNGCHDVGDDHGRWLPDVGRHLQTLSCEACHVPHVPTPSVAQTDWTVLDAHGDPVVAHRGVEGAIDDPAALLTGYEPVLLPRRDADGRVRYVPHALATTWTWLGGVPERPVRPFDLRAAWFGADGAPHPDVVAALDTDRDGRLAASELALDTPAKVAAVRTRLVAVGVEAPRIVGTVEPTGLHHGIVGAGAIRRCETCHAPDGRLARPTVVATRVPAGATATFSAHASVALPGSLAGDAGGPLVHTPSTSAAGRYVLRQDDAGVLDLVGLVAFVGTVLGVAGHALARVVAHRRAGRTS